MEDADLGAALDMLAARMSAAHGISCRLEKASDVELDEQTAHELYRIAQEALTNVAKHAEAAHADIRRECERLLAFRSGITDMSKLGGQYTERGIHTIQWKAFMLKSGTFIEENCALAPKTAAVLRPLGNVYNAFFSIVEPHQYITPHWGYYKGFLRYHLGVTYQALGENEKAADQFKKARELAPGDADLNRKIDAALKSRPPEKDKS